MYSLNLLSIYYCIYPSIHDNSSLTVPCGLSLPLKQVEVTPGNRGVFAAACSRQLHVDFDIEHQVWHLVPRTTTTTIASERSSITGPKKRRGRQIEGARAVECSSSPSEAHSSGSHVTPGETTVLSENHDLGKAADLKCRIAGDAGSSEVPGGLQQPAGDGERVDECTPAKKGLPSKEETVTPANEQAGAAATSESTTFPADEVSGRAGDDHCFPDECVDTVVSILGSSYWQSTCVLW